MKPILALALAGVLLAACAHPGEVRLTAGKALAGAELAVTGANLSAKTAAETGACKGACTVKARDILGKANACVGAAYSAYQAADLPTAAAKLTECFTTIADAKATLEGR